MPASGEVSYALIFPAVPASTAFIDYGEANEKVHGLFTISGWNQSSADLLPKAMIGNWFDKRQRDWKFGIYEKHRLQKTKSGLILSRKRRKLSILGYRNKNVTHELFYKINGEEVYLLVKRLKPWEEYNNNAKLKPEWKNLPMTNLTGCRFSTSIRLLTAAILKLHCEPGENNFSFVGWHYYQ